MLTRAAARRKERMAAPGCAAADGLEAFGDGNYKAAFANLSTARATLQLAGGSHAQRDVFERITIDAGLRAGQLDEVEAILDDRRVKRGGIRGQLRPGPPRPDRPGPELVPAPQAFPPNKTLQGPETTDVQRCALPRASERPPAAANRAAPPPQAAQPRVRDPRLDFYRGIAMFIILVAHIPGNRWAGWIPARFGFSDATEIFVFCSGMASAIAFGSSYARQGWWLGTMPGSSSAAGRSTGPISACSSSSPHRWLPSTSMAASTRAISAR